jgi:hypothetical protein
VNEIEVAPRGADVRGRITTANDAGRIAGSAELGLELTQLYINGIPYAMSTSEYSEAGKSRTARRFSVLVSEPVSARLSELLPAEGKALRSVPASVLEQEPPAGPHEG